MAEISGPVEVSAVGSSSTVFNHPDEIAEAVPLFMWQGGARCLPQFPSTGTLPLPADLSTIVLVAPASSSVVVNPDVEIPDAVPVVNCTDTIDAFADSVCTCALL